MDHCASILLGFPDPMVADAQDNDMYEQYESALKHHVGRVEALFKEQSGTIGANALQLLDCLDPAVNSLSYLALLELLTNVNNPKDNDAAVVEKIVVFLLTFDARQIRYAGSIFSSLFGLIASGQAAPPPIAVHALTQALLRVDPTGSMLTSNHITLVKLAYHTDNIALALPVISKSIVYYPGMANQNDPKLLSDPNLPPPSYISKNTGLTTSLKAAQILEYDIIVGLMHTSLRDWASARAAFERVATYPTRDGGVSKIMVDAYKRWLLVGLLLRGKTATTPQHTSNAAGKAFGTLGKAYLQVVESFDTMDAVALQISAQASWQSFVDDACEGLMREVIAAHQKWQIANLRKIYSKISIAEIRRKTKSAETGNGLTKDADVEALIEGMIQSSMLKATIQKPAGGAPYLEFLPAASDLSEAEYAKEILRSAQRIKSLEPIFKATNERLGTSKDYVRHLIREQKRDRDGTRDAGFEEQIEDEDLMTGVLS